MDISNSINDSAHAIALAAVHVKKFKIRYSLLITCVIGIPSFMAGLEEIEKLNPFITKAAFASELKKVTDDFHDSIEALIRKINEINTNSNRITRAVENMEKRTVIADYDVQCSKARAYVENGKTIPGNVIEELDKRYRAVISYDKSFPRCRLFSR